MVYNTRHYWVLDFSIICYPKVHNISETDQFPSGNGVGDTYSVRPVRKI
jgi:hypothetical protein